MVILCGILAATAGGLTGRGLEKLRKTITKYCVVFKKVSTIPDNESGRTLSLRIYAGFAITSRLL
jgi:hypothetical protein